MSKKLNKNVLKLKKKMFKKRKIDQKVKKRFQDFKKNAQDCFCVCIFMKFWQFQKKRKKTILGQNVSTV